MSTLADMPELVGFFSYSREDDLDSGNALSQLRSRIQNELRAQLGRSRDALRLWQDAEAIPPGSLWANEIDVAVAQATFFIPIITPRVVFSQYCGLEFEKFLAREKALGRADLVFPILYIDVEDLRDESRWSSTPVLRAIAERQYVDWRDYRYEPDSPAFRRAVAQFCTKIAQALRRRSIAGQPPLSQVPSRPSTPDLGRPTSAHSVENTEDGRPDRPYAPETTPASSRALTLITVGAACASATMGLVAIAVMRNQAAIILCGLFCACFIAFSYYQRGYRSWQLLLTVMIAATGIFSLSILALPFVFANTVTIYK